MKITDISMKLENGMLAYPTNNRIKISRSKSIKKDGAHQSYICMECHTGTHIDVAYYAMSAPKVGKFENRISEVHLLLSFRYLSRLVCLP